MMKKYILLIFGVCSCTFTYGQQNTSIYLPATDAMRHGSCDLRKWNIIDNADLTVHYTSLYLSDTLKNCNRLLDVAILQIGPAYSRFYSYHRQRADSSYTDKLQNGPRQLSGFPKEKAQQKGWMNFELLFDKEKHICFSRHRLPWQDDVVICCENEEETIPWELLTEQKMIHGYNCFKANANYAGRVWTAWYAPEVPLPEGPWKLRGLPGLIVEAYDEKEHFSFKADVITGRQEPIYNYKWKTQHMTHKEWLNYERNYHRRPIDFVNTTNVYYMDRTTGDLIQLDDSWTIPYNPIELE